MCESEEGPLNLGAVESGSILSPYAQALHRVGGREAVVVCDKLNHRVAAVDARGRLVAVAKGAGGQERGLFEGPRDVAVMGRTGEVLVADYNNSRIVVLRGDDLSCTRSVDLAWPPLSLCADAESGRVFVTELRTKSVRSSQMRSPTSRVTVMLRRVRSTNQSRTRVLAGSSGRTISSHTPSASAPSRTHHVPSTRIGLSDNGLTNRTSTWHGS